MNTTLLRERPGCRRQLLKLANLVPDVRDGVWDGRTIRDLDHVDQNNGGYYEICLVFSEGMSKQFRLMVEEGHYGNIRIVPPAQHLVSHPDGRRTWVSDYSLDDIRHFGSGHRYPYGHCQECWDRRAKVLQVGATSPE